MVGGRGYSSQTLKYLYRACMVLPRTNLIWLALGDILSRDGFTTSCVCSYYCTDSAFAAEARNRRGHEMDVGEGVGGGRMVGEEGIIKLQAESKVQDEQFATT